MTVNWPVADIDAVARLRVLAEATDAMFVDGVIGAPFADVWAVAGDLEHELPWLLPDVRSLLITSAQGNRLEGHARGYAGLRARFDIVLEPGWCVMQSRFLLGGMAAVPVGDTTHFAFLGAFRFPGNRVAAPILRRLTRPVGTRVITRLRQRLEPPDETGS